jgi:glycosyltransferase involved in cell wall biosynthesis
VKIGMFMAFAGRNCGGPEVFERELFRALFKIAPGHDYHLYCLSRRAPEVLEVQAANVSYHLLRPSARPVAMAAGLPLAISRTRPDIVHAVSVPPPLIPPNLVYTLYCSSMFLRPELYPLPQRLRLRFLLYRGIPRAAKVICVSEHVRDATLQTFPLSANQVPVIHPGVSPEFRPLPEDQKRRVVEERYGIRDPYFLFSGRWERRKNVSGILKAFALFKSQSKTAHKLVFTGQRTWAADEADRLITKLGLRQEIIDLGKTSFDELPYLYGAADALVYVSLWEGFGMPIVESMACGTPVITSDVSAMPETAGGAALLVSPQSVEGIAAAMYRIATEPELRASLGRKGLQRAPLFTWEKAARKTFQVYEEIAAGSRQKANESSV